MRRIQIREFLTKQSVSSLFFALLTTMAFFSKKTAADAEAAAEWLRLNYWNQINISNIHFNLEKPAYLQITRFQLNYEDAYGLLPAFFCVLLFIAYFGCGGNGGYTRRNKVISAAGAFFIPHSQS